MAVIRDQAEGATLFPARTSGSRFVRGARGAAGAPDVVAPQGLPHGVSRQLQDRRARRDAEGDRGESEVLERRPERVELTGEQAVHDGDPRHARRRDLTDVQLADGARRDRPDGVEEQDEQDPEPEARHGDSELDDRLTDSVDHASRMEGRQDPERNRPEEAQEERRRGELERGGEPAPDLLRHGLLGVLRNPEVAAEEPAQIIDELRREVVVVAELLAELLDLLRRRPRPEDQAGGVSQDVGDEEDQCDHAQHRQGGADELAGNAEPPARRAPWPMPLIASRNARLSALQVAVRHERVRLVDDPSDASAGPAAGSWARRG